MPALAELLAKRSGVALGAPAVSAAELEQGGFSQYIPILSKRVSIPCCFWNSPPGLVEAETVDPWQKSGKYALGWTYFCSILLVLTAGVRWYQFWNDKMRTVHEKEITEQTIATYTPETDYPVSALSSLHSARTTQHFFPKEGPLPGERIERDEFKSKRMSRPINFIIALFRSAFYHPVPSIRLQKGWRPIVFPSLGVIMIFLAALIFVLGYDLIPQPLYWQSIRFGSPPVAIRAGMMAIAMMPWIIGLSMKANLISIITGIGHERLNALHRWLAYIFLILSLIHTIPFYIAPVWEDGGRKVFASFFNTGYYVYGSGIAALVPTLVLCIHSVPPLRRKFYELFVIIHVPVSVVLVGTLFWHCNNFLTSWNYLYATIGIWLSSYIIRLFYLNWVNPFRVSWLIGEEAAVSVLPANAVKITIPTQMKWSPGQYVYLRMPGVSAIENHPFTIASLCSEDFPSEYGGEYRDLVLVYRPFSGFTQRVVEMALERGPWHTYRAFLDGPYGGMRRNMESFDHVVMIAGGSGITAVVSQLLDLIKRVRDGKAATKSVQLIWALKRPEALEWFKEELRICREFAPSDAVQCHFYITAAKRQKYTGQLVSATTPNRPVSALFHDKLNDIFQNIASNRFSTISSQRNSAMIRDEAQGDPELEKELRAENADRIRPLPAAHLKPAPTYPSSRGLGLLSGLPDSIPTKEVPHMPPHPTLHEKRRSHALSLDITTAKANHAAQMETFTALPDAQDFDFGFPSTPSEFQKNLMRFAFMPAAAKQKSGWSIEWGRPDIPYMLRDMSRHWTGARTCVFVCGPPGMREDVSHAVASLQTRVLSGKQEEILLHAENYAL